MAEEVVDNADMTEIRTQLKDVKKQIEAQNTPFDRPTIAKSENVRYLENSLQNKTSNPLKDSYGKKPNVQSAITRRQALYSVGPSQKQSMNVSRPLMRVGQDTRFVTHNKNAVHTLKSPDEKVDRDMATEKDTRTNPRVTQRTVQDVSVATPLNTGRFFFTHQTLDAQ